MASGSVGDVCASDGAAARAVRVALAYAEQQGVAREQLADCRFDAAHCGAEPAPPIDVADGARCVIDVGTAGGYFQVRVHPRALAGAPRWIDMSLDANSAEPPRRFYLGASTWAVGVHHAVVVSGVDGHISHTHGGDSAHIGHAEVSIRNGSNAALRVTARSVEWLTSASCDVPFEVRARPPVAGLTLAESDAQTPELVLPAGVTSSVTVWFSPQDAYYSYCDRFSVRVTLDVDGEMLSPVAEWEVTRREPPRREGP